MHSFKYPIRIRDLIVPSSLLHPFFLHLSLPPSFPPFPCHYPPTTRDSSWERGRRRKKEEEEEEGGAFVIRKLSAAHRVFAPNGIWMSLVGVTGREEKGILSLLHRPDPPSRFRHPWGWCRPPVGKTTPYVVLADVRGVYGFIRKEGGGRENRFHRLSSNCLIFCCPPPLLPIFYVLSFVHSGAKRLEGGEREEGEGRREKRGGRRNTMATRRLLDGNPWWEKWIDDIISDGEKCNEETIR